MAVKGRGVSVKRVASWIWYILIITFLITVLNSVLKHGASDRAMDDISIFGYRPVVVVSGSMEPEVLTNSISVLQYCGIEDIEVGDIVMYRHPTLGINVTHRVIEEGVDLAGNKFIKTKGDANSFEDNVKIDDEMLAGKLVKTYNGLAKYVNFIMLRPGEVNTFALLQVLLAVAVSLAVILTVLSMLWELIVSIWTILFGSRKLDILVARYKEDVEYLQKLESSIEEFNNSKGFGIINTMRKVRLMRELKALDADVADIKQTMQFIGTKRSSKVGTTTLDAEGPKGTESPKGGQSERTKHIEVLEIEKE